MNSGAGPLPYIISDMVGWIVAGIFALVTGAFTQVHWRINHLRTETEARIQRVEDDQKDHNKMLWEAIDGLRGDLKLIASKEDLHREIDRLAAMLPRPGGD